jgi:uncharacterized protein DUF6624
LAHTTRSGNRNSRVSSFGVAALFCAATSLFAQSPLPIEREAFDAFNSKDFARCAQLYRRLAAEFPDQAGYNVGVARCYDGAGRKGDAEHFIDIALQKGYRNCLGLPIHTSDFDQRCAVNEEQWLDSLNREVYLAFLADQEDRKPPIEDVDAVRKRDAARLRLAKIAVAKNLLRTADDSYHAGMIFQHGPETADIETAARLAKKATAMRPNFPAARWLYAAATDRHLQRLGKPQIYGTQYKMVEGAWTMEPYDRKGVTDAERMRWRVPSLAEQEERIAQMNAARH